jgi:dTDP-4-amino-4,6-dideoxygalactose transaminase
MTRPSSAADVTRLPSDQDSTGRTFGEEEVANVAAALASGVLTSTKGTFTKAFEARFAELLGAKHAWACSSGTAALHVAFGAVDPEPGDEIVTTPITDMGALTPIVYQGAIPVFADVDPRSCNVTAATIEPKLSEKTKAIVVTHLFGNPCAMDQILDLARSRGIPVIEDCAQAFLAKSAGKWVGRIGSIGCFSLQQGKHITTGEGGIVVTDDPELSRRMFLHVNKAWGYGDQNPDHYFLALNYRMSELQGAVALAQLDKLPGVVEARRRTAAMLNGRLAGVPGLTLVGDDPRNENVYWKYCVMVDGNVIEGGSPGLGARLKERGIACAPRYIQKPAFRCQVFAEQRTFGNSRWPFPLARPEAVDYAKERYPGTFAALRDVLVLPWNEKYDEDHVEWIAESVRWAAGTTEG